MRRSKEDARAEATFGAARISEHDPDCGQQTALRDCSKLLALGSICFYTLTFYMSK